MVVLKSLVFIGCIKLHVIKITVDAQRSDTNFEGKFGTLNQKDEV